MNILLQQLRCIMPAAGPNLALFLPHLNNAMFLFDINSDKRQAHFLAQLAHETGQLRTLSENLNYSPAGLLLTFNTSKIKRFTPEQAEKYGRTAAHAANQEMIANIAYANRMGNGGPETGDGWRYRGAGAFQLTGKDNHRACAEHFRMPVEQLGDWLRSAEGACMSAAWFWQKNGCNALADKNDIDGISDIVNIGRRTQAFGDANGFKDRQALASVAAKVLA